MECVYLFFVIGGRILVIACVYVCVCLLKTDSKLASLHFYH